MAITYEYVGKTGGTKVTEIPVNFISPSATGIQDVTTVQLPEGREYRVTLIIDSIAVDGSSILSMPELILGGVNKGKLLSGAAGASVVSQGSVDIQVNRKSTSGSYSPSFTGTVYYWPTS